MPTSNATEKRSPGWCRSIPDFEVSRADRGSAQIDAFDSNFWDAPDLRPVYPIVASYTTAKITLPKIRYICDPMQPAISGTVAL